ncbi:hypothetical protein [Plantactinospora sp. B5E13]|uniref:hypothetical protein n=1 Tax=Plantactinospora sp. B5E13 TaxID=3153758 RepID=UPI00325EE29E
MTDTSHTSTTTATGILHAHGRITWRHLATALHDTDGTAWADYDGFHIGAAPTSPPPYTHLWAWTADWLLRARLDGDAAIVGVLQTGTTTPQLPHPGPPAATEPITYTIRHAHTWPANENRVGPLNPTITDRPADLYHTHGTHPITFVRIR